MNADLARLIAIGSTVVTVAALLLALRFSRRPARVKAPMEMAMLAVSLVAIPGMAFATRVHTNAGFALLALAVGVALGGLQGGHLKLERREQRIYARRSTMALMAWGGGVAVIQGAGAADRAGVVEIGQALSYFGIGTSFGLLVGRQGSINRLSTGAIAGVAIVLASVAAVSIPPYAGRPASAQTPPPTEVVLKGTVDIQLLVDAFALDGAGGKPGKRDIRLVFPGSGGAVSGEAAMYIEDFPYGALVALMEGLGEAIGGAITGDDSPASPARPELANCRATLENDLVLKGTFDAATGKLSGTYTLVQGFTNHRSCPADSIALEEAAGRAGSWEATFDGTAARGTIFAKDTPSVPFSASVPDKEEDPTPAAAVATNDGNTDQPSGEDDDASLLPPIDVPEEIAPGEAAAAGLIGLVPVIVVIGVSVSQTVAAGSAAGSAAERSEPLPEVAELPPPPPRGPQPITPETAGIAADNIREMAEKAGYGDIVAAIDRRAAAGPIDPADLEELREILKRRIALDEHMANAELWTTSDGTAFIRGTQEDAARLAEILGQPGIAILLRNPEMAARIGAAVATGGWSEVPLTAWDVYSALDKAANTPGASLDNTGAAVEIAKVVGWEAAVNVAGDRLVGGALGAGARAVGMDDAVRGAAHGADDAVRGASRTADEAITGGSRATDGAVQGAGRPPGGGAVDPAAGGRPDLDGGAGGGGTGSGGGRAAEAPAGQSSGGAGAQSPEPAVQPGRGAGAEVPQQGAQPQAAAGEWTNLKEAPDGSSVPLERIGEAGYTKQQAEALRDVATDEGVLIGSRTTNPDSVAHMDAGTALPKPVDIKAKTTTPLDVELGARPQDKGLVTLFEPKQPPYDISRPDVAADPHAVAVWERYNQRMAEFGKLKAEAEARPDLQWDRSTGVIYDRATGKPFAGDIDVVYIRDAKTGELVGGDRAQRIMDRLGASDARTQHGAEVQAVSDITAAKGPGATGSAVNLQESLSQGHQTGAETVIETSAGGWQKGPSAQGMYDSHSPSGPASGLRRGIGMELPD